jgi:hypothetical protein
VLTAPPQFDVVAGVGRVVGPRKCRVVTTSRFSSPAAAHTAEYKPRPLLICILASAIVLYFHINSASTTMLATMAAEMRHTHSRNVIKAPRRDPSPPTIELRKTIR